MTKQKKILFSAVGAVVVIALAIAAFFAFGNSTDEPKTSRFDDTPVATSSPTPTTRPSDAPEPGETVAPKEDKPVVNVEGQLALAQEMFPDATSTTTHSKDEVQLALYTAYMYANQATSDTYFLSGKWLEESYSAEQYDSILGEYFTVQAYSTIQAALGNVSSTDEKTFTDAQNQLLSTVLYSAAGGDTGYDMTETCINQGDDCLKSATPKFSDISFTDDPNDATRILVQFTLTTDPIYTHEGNRGHIDAEYKFNLYMKAATEENSRTEGFVYSYLVDGFQADVDKSGWKQD